MVSLGAASPLSVWDCYRVDWWIVRKKEISDEGSTNNGGF